MAWLATSLLTILTFVSISTSQQTALITELPAYSSLSSCAATAVSSAAVELFSLLCSATTSPVPLASCICLTVTNSAAASRFIAGAAEFCAETASPPTSLALGVLTTYCAAASQNDIGPQATTKTTGSLTGASNTASPTSPAAFSFTITDFGASGTSASSSFSGSQSSSPSTTSSSPTQTGGGGGISLSDKIALGTGIGVGLPATLAGVYVAYIEFVRRREGR